VKSCRQLLAEFQRSQTSYQAEKLVFKGVGDRDVYNIAAPFRDKGEEVIAGRVEGRNTERSEVMFFIQRNGAWMPRENTRTFALQDPFFTFIKGELVFGGVEVVFDPERSETVKTWRTLFYRGSDIDSLEYFAAGPDQMKDIRLVELANGKIGVFTRPLGVGDARALIGYTEIDALEQLTAETIENALLFRDQFRKDEWGGANEAHLLGNGLIGVLGHICYMEEGEIRHYHAMTFAYDPKTGARTPMKIIAVRSQFPEGPAKRPDLADVIFSGGIHRLSGGKAMLYAGVSDAEAHRILIDDPFTEYEKL
jgi:hypothetical protein